MSGLSPDLMARMMADLEAMRQKDPSTFLSIMQSAGVPSAPPAPPSPGGSGGELPPITPEQLEMFMKLMQQTMGEGQGLDSVNLPGGAASLGPKGVETKPAGKYVTPSPGFVVKTRAENEGAAKVFINICTHEELGEPSIKKRLDDNGEEIEGLNIPLSVGPPRTSEDKTGAPCVVYDIMVNPKVVTNAQEDKVGKDKDFLCQLAIQSLEQKYSISLDRRYKLPKLKVFGELQQQYIQDRKKMPKIEELDSNKASSKSSSSKKVLIAPTVVKDDVKFVYLMGWEVRGKNGEISPEFPWKYPLGEYVEPLHVPDEAVSGILLLAEVELLSLKDVIIKASPFRCQIKVKGYLGVSVYFPCAVSPPECSCQLERPAGAVKTATLKVHFPIDRNPWEAFADPGSKPWLMSQAMNGDSEDLESGSVALYRNLAHASVRALEENSTQDNKDITTKANKSGHSIESEDEELPEDKFHRKDAMSSYILQQRKDDAKEKQDRHEKEKAERLNDPNVEYVDAEDYRPGGKYGEPLSTNVEEKRSKKEIDSHLAHLQQASSVLDAVVSQTVDPAAKSDHVVEDAPGLASMSSKMWTELL